MFKLTRHSKILARQALTLLELLVVLVILSIVATVAVNSLQPRIQSARYRQTESLLKSIENAVVGDTQSAQADGTPIINGFIADVGRLPIVQRNIAGDLEGIQQADDVGFDELYDPQCELAVQFPFQFRSGPKGPVDYSDIQLACGWRGPYLHLAAGRQSLRDGWGQPFEVQEGPSGEVQQLVWQPLEPYTEPLVGSLTTGKVSVTGTINFDQTLPPDIQVVLLAPDPETSHTHLRVFADEESSAAAFAFSNVPVGLRAIRISWADQQITKYVHVPHQGLSMIVDLNGTESNTE